MAQASVVPLTTPTSWNTNTKNTLNLPKYWRGIEPQNTLSICTILSPYTGWHGASASNGMSHIAIQENLNEKVVEWMENG